jgi:lipoprotein-releasing system ATP-binding protein
MSDELRRMLSEATNARRTAVGPPRLGIGPRVKGGLPLAGGPRLEVPSPDGELLRSHDPAHAVLAGPHLVLDNDQCADEPTNDTAPAGSQLAAIDLWKTYRKGPVEVPVLGGLSLEVRQGEFLAVIGQSGSGKSTLLHLLGTLDVPDKGQIHFEGRRIDNLWPSGRDALRNRRFGMIFQFYHLLPELTTLENVLAPLMIAHGALGYLRHRRRHRDRAIELLETVGLEHRLKHRPRELSGGEMQRAAIARSLIAQPALLLADEPTGNLDQATGREIVRLLGDLNRRENLTIVMVTHDPAIAARADRIVRLSEGRIVG